MSSADPTAQFQQALALHRQGRLNEAEALYRARTGQPSPRISAHSTSPA